MLAPAARSRSPRAVPLPLALLLAWALGACATPPPKAPELLGPALVAPGPGQEPLVDLLDAGFTAAVMQVRLEDDRLVSGPGGERDFVLDDLRPLVRRFAEGGGPESFLLLLVIRDAPDATYAALTPVLHAVREHLARFEGGGLVPGPVRVVLTGAVPLEHMVRERTRYAFVAGGPRELESSPYSPDLLPLVRVRYDYLMSWDGHGSVPEDQRMALQAVTARAHVQGRLVAVREAPQAAWEALLVGGVDYIESGAVGSRDTNRLAHFLGRRKRR